MPDDEISHPIHVIFYEIILPSGHKPCAVISKGHKLWLYISGDHPIPEKVDKETDSVSAIRIEDWENANH